LFQFNVVANRQHYSLTYVDTEISNLQRFMVYFTRILIELHEKYLTVKLRVTKNKHQLKHLH